jgi:hypothetical protein
MNTPEVFRKLVRFREAERIFTDTRSRRSPRSPWCVEREPGAAIGNRAGLGGVMCDVEAGVRYVITEITMGGGQSVEQSPCQPRAPLSAHVLRRLAGRTGESRQSR